MTSLFRQVLGFLRNMRGSKRGPLLCLALITVILTGLVSFRSGFLPQPLVEKGRFCLAAISNAVTGADKKGICFDTQTAVLSESFLNTSQRALPESPELLLMGDGSLKSAAPPTTFSSQALGALVGGYEQEDVKKVITEYTVEQGETISLIAEKFGISVNTILWANNLSKGSTLKPGQTIIVPPVSGVIHHVKSGDTVSSIAKKYKGKAEDVVSFNSLSSENDIYVGDIVFVPSGTMPAATKNIAPQTIAVADSYFICPISAPCRVSQRLHWYNAVDFSHSKCGDFIFAAAGGTVLKVKLTESISRWALGGGGNTITILHPNGVVTSYGHVAASLVSVGDQVSQGQVIALMGGKPGTPGAGLSTGCHVHFAVSGAKNPFR